MEQKGDYMHFYFCYRWFLLDYKRELLYNDVFTVWETIWTAKYMATDSFSLFLAVALLETYRDIILSNSMDFTDIIRFFNGEQIIEYTCIYILVRSLIIVFLFRNGRATQCPINAAVVAQSCPTIADNNTEEISSSFFKWEPDIEDGLASVHLCICVRCLCV